MLIYIYTSCHSDTFNYEAAENVTKQPGRPPFPSLSEGHPGLMFVASCPGGLRKPCEIVNRRVAGLKCLDSRGNRLAEEKKLASQTELKAVNWRI